MRPRRRIPGSSWVRLRAPSAERSSAARPDRVIAQGSQFGLGTLLLRYSRDFEKQADLLGAQIMARAGYDPRALARMFETIQREAQTSGGGGPQWLSSHPDPGNRTQYITQEAERADHCAGARLERFRGRQDGIRVAAGSQVDG